MGLHLGYNCEEKNRGAERYSSVDEQLPDAGSESKPGFASGKLAAEVEPVLDPETSDSEKIPLPKNTKPKSAAAPTPPGEPREVTSTNSYPSPRPTKRLTIGLVVVILFIGIYAFASKSSSGDIGKIQAKVALSEQELKDVVAANHLTVYWAGPLEGANYTLSATSPGIVFLKYIPKGVDFRDTKIFFRTIGTYSMANAFLVTRSTGALKGNVGFTTADGYSAFYSLSRPTNIYLGVNKLKLQIEIFDPHAEQARGLATVQGQIRKLA